MVSRETKLHVHTASFTAALPVIPVVRPNCSKAKCPTSELYIHTAGNKSAIKQNELWIRESQITCWMREITVPLPPKKSVLYDSIYIKSWKMQIHLYRQRQVPGRLGQGRDENSFRRMDMLIIFERMVSVVVCQNLLNCAFKIWWCVICVPGPSVDVLP